MREKKTPNVPSPIKAGKWSDVNGSKQGQFAQTDKYISSVKTISNDVKHPVSPTNTGFMRWLKSRNKLLGSFLIAHSGWLQPSEWLHKKHLNSELNAIHRFTFLFCSVFGSRGSYWCNLMQSLIPFGRVYMEDNAITVLRSVANDLRWKLPDEQALSLC